MTDFYKILGVSSDASQEAIKAVYRKKMLECHPDRNPSDEAQELAKSINEAWSVIGDPEKRKQYDLQRSGAQHGFPGGGFNPQQGDFDSFFHSFMRRGQPRRGRNIQYRLSISLYDSIFGTKKDIEYSYQTECDKCSVTCDTCDGSGSVARRAGPMMVTAPCPACGGAGSKSPGCSECTNGQKTVDRKVSVTIPPGVQDGAKLGLAGAGLEGEAKAPAGDLIVHLMVEIPVADKFTKEQKEQLKKLLGDL